MLLGKKVGGIDTSPRSLKYWLFNNTVSLAGMKAEIVQFLVSTAREFGTRQVSTVDPYAIASLNLTGIFIPHHTFTHSDRLTHLKLFLK